MEVGAGDQIRYFAFCCVPHGVDDGVNPLPA